MVLNKTQRNINPNKPPPSAGAAARGLAVLKPVQTPTVQTPAVQPPPKPVTKPEPTVSYGGGEGWFSFLWRFFSGY